MAFMDAITRYHEAVRYLESLGNIPAAPVTDPTVHVRRMRWFLGLLGNPCAKARFVHVTGTAGKGTVTTMVHEMLHASGAVVGAHTSPFVTTTVEKFRVGAAHISAEEFAEIVEGLKPHVDRAHFEGPFGRPTYFELCLAIALLHFERSGCEWVVLEVGIGGRYDATNYIERPEVTVITTIDYDHVEILGKTLTAIATDKAGIIKAGSRFFTAEQRPSLVRLFKRICAERGAAFFQVQPQTDHRAYNAALARAVGEALGISAAHREKGIARARLPCRFEVVRRSPLVVLDGAHNPVKIRSALENLRTLDFRRLHLVVGIAESKDLRAIMRLLAPVAHRLHLTRFQMPGRKCADPKELLRLSRPLARRGARVEAFLDPGAALSRSLALAAPEDAVLVIGSFFLAGELRARWYPEAQVLRRRSSF
jgi:dihydrofolate synthase/folylpolyglutamate synthase